MAGNQLNRSQCPHVTTVGGNSWEEINLVKQHQKSCQTCNANVRNLWLCMHARCFYVGCGESVDDHSNIHAEKRKHFLTLNMTTNRIWCYKCESEVYANANDPPLIMREKTVTGTGADVPLHSPRLSPSLSASSQIEEQSDSDDDDDNVKSRGLVGLQNIGNTCYMNAALQALSNCPPLTRFFLDCPGYVRPEIKPMLSKSYMKLVLDIWSKRRPSYVMPSGVAHGIKMIHPMFRGYTQQDTQEFLRCFMDQVHEELKHPIRYSTNDITESKYKQEVPQDDPSDASVPEGQPLVESHNQSDTDYETCDSGMSSERSSMEHVPVIENAGDNVRLNTDQSTEIDKTKIKESTSVTSDLGPSIHGSATDSRISNEELVATMEQEATEYMDSMSMNDGDADEGQRVRQRSRGISEAERSTARGHVQAATKGKKKKMREYGSIISDIFDGRILSSVQCLTCERVSSMNETFQDLSLPIPSKDHLHMLHANQGTTLKGSCGEVNLHQGWFSWMFGWMKSWFWGPMVTLQDCLAAFFSADELKGDNMYSCEKCKKLRNGIKYSKVTKLPEVLCIHLKRFRHEFMFSSKISTYVAFPMEGLDMGPCLHKDCQDQITTYDLIGVICHHGTSGGGHYTAYCLNYHNEQWYEYDDQYVTEVDIQQVENCEAYVLFYRKKNDLMYSQRQKAKDLLETTESSFMKFYISKQWINKFNTFAEPGSISNGDFLCKHGGVHPSQWQYVDDLFTELPQPVWELFHQQYGGGPAVNHLYLCTTCQTEMERLKKRQKMEIDTLTKFNEDFQNDENPVCIYAISMVWFKEWEEFVKERTDEPPGPIDNDKIAIFHKNGTVSVKPNSDYGQISPAQWHFLLKTYGGGPELVHRENRPPSPSEENITLEQET